MAIPLPGTPIIVDIGSAYSKIGFAGEPSPRFVFPTITGTEKYKAVMVDVGARNIYVGSDASKMRGVLKIKYPIERGAILDWNDYYEILNYIFYSLLRIENLSNYPVLYTEPPFLNQETKEYIARVLYETHKVRSLIMIPTPILSLFSVGLTTGIVIESGHGTSWICPIISGEIVDQSVQKLTLAGTDVNQHLKNLLMREGINIESSAVDEIIKEIKERNCVFALDPENPPNLDDNFSFTMPDGSNIRIPNYIFHEAPEVLFKPNLLGYNILNIPQAVINSVKSIDQYYWSDLLSHIMLSGGNLSYSGFEERLRTELVQLVPQLGKIPKPKLIKASKDEKQKMKLKERSVKKEDTCPHCGVLVDLTDGKEFCPSCNGRIALPELSIGSTTLAKKPKLNNGNLVCPNCKKLIGDTSSIFCPYCGGSFQAKTLPEIPPEIIKQSPPAMEFSGFYESSDEVIRFFVPENLQFAIFNGASILGSLPSFQSLFVSYEEFKTNSNALYKNISEIF
ncbi:MAG: zinc ribbon domain-containing protein [Candidatus Lokiarchaeota archaeon]|nr:zinc ribbon domain-containing protein [Candidatus Lokiarchaeota archaeon]